MSRYLPGLMALFSLVCIAVLPPEVTADADPLFRTNNPITVTLTAPFRAINKDRDTERRDPVVVRYVTESGDKVEIPALISARGNKRRNRSTCKFVPVRLHFDKQDVKGTLFEKQKKLKVVTQCDPHARKYEGYTQTEHLAYRILNTLTDNSYRVRLAQFTYVDAERGETLHESYGFFIESTRRMAKRLDRERLRIAETSATELDGAHLNLVSLFQMMLGNTDWSATHGGNDECCHNGKLLSGSDENELVMNDPAVNNSAAINAAVSDVTRGNPDNLYIPYDFDMTGLVNPEYATVDKRMKLQNIRERRYRGYCRNNKFLDDNIALFNTKRAEIMALTTDATLFTKNRIRVNKAYIKRFYRLINDPKRLAKKVEKWCHESLMVAQPAT